MSSTSLIALARNDLRIFFSDRRAVLITFALPIVLAAFMGWLFGGSGGSGKASAVAIQVVDRDASPVSRKIIAALKADTSLKIAPTTEAKARAAVRKGTVPVAVIFPPGFGAAATQSFFTPDHKPRLTVLHDPSQAAAKGMVEGILTQHIMQVVSATVFLGQGARSTISNALAHLDDSGIPAADRPAFRDMLQSVSRWYDVQKSDGPGGAKMGLGLPYSVDDEAITGADTQYNSYAHAFAGMAIMFIFFGAIDMAVGLLQDRERGLWRRLCAAPISRGVIPLGKMASTTVLLLLEILVSYAVARAVFGVHIQAMAGFLLVGFASALCAAAFGLLIAGLGKTPEASRGLAIFAVLMLSMLGGAWMPTFIFPAWLQKVTVIIPTRWAIDGLEAVTWRGMGLHAALAPTAALLVFTLLFTGVALARFRWTAQSA